MINADRKLRPYLRNYPATIRELDFSISFAIDHSRELSSQVRRVAKYDKVTYFDFNSKEIHQESYEEALRIIREEEQQCEVTKNESLN